MAVLKCKMCGGELQIQPGATIAQCEYCDTKQTVPGSFDDKKANLYNQANDLRIKCEFDRAASVYDSIVAEFPEEAEAYWCLVLCNYGIEYVDDPKTGKKIPTCHRASYDSVQADENYIKAIKYADQDAKAIYRQEAAYIDNLCEEILTICKNEKPYDVFICYKETDENGDRTIDSDYAERIYDQLTQKGYKVFFSRITLEDKGGLKYEPYIFAALNTAKVMLAVGTSPEYFNAVWVKNEWSRYLKLMRNDKSKLLIPCFMGMSPDDLPREFRGLQAQNLGKIGVITDISRGIEKLIPLKNQNIAGEVTVEKLLERAYIFLRNNQYDNANEYFEKILDRDPHESRAYWGKILCNERCIDNTDLVSDRKVKEYFDRISHNCTAQKQPDQVYDEYIKTIWGAELQNAIAFSEGEDQEMYLSWYQKMRNPLLAKMHARQKAIEADYRKFKRKERRSFAVKAVVIVAALSIVAGAIYRGAVITPRKKEEERQRRYQLATAYLEQGNYENAYEIFKELEGFYDDIPEKLRQTNAGMNLSALKNCQVGDTVKLGVYEQDNDEDTTDEEIEWQVLEIKDGKALIISSYVLDTSVYHNEQTQIAWKDSKLYSFLNEDFAQSAFVDLEKGVIADSEQGKIFVLSREEAEKYFTDAESRKSEATEYAHSKGIHTTLIAGNGTWWLRDDNNGTNAVVIYFNGEISKEEKVDTDYYGLRPAMWIDLSLIK